MVNQKKGGKLMVKLYIDFDGVIKNTIAYMYQEMDKLGIEWRGVHTNSKEVEEYIKNLDWEYLLHNTSFINNSIKAIKEIKNTNLYDIKILTHINSKNEAIQKEIYLKKVLPEVEVITVPKQIDKAKFVDATGAILVDDYKKNLKIWKHHGGIPIHFDEERSESDYPVISCLFEITDLTYDYAKKIKGKEHKNKKLVKQER